MKKCSMCNLIKLLNCFGVDKTRKDGLKYNCKICNKEVYQKNKNKISSRNKIFYLENREKLKERKKKYQEENREKLKERKKKYQEENREKLKERVKKYREENRLDIRERDKKRYAENRLSKCISVEIYNSLKDKKAGRHWEDLVPYNYFDLKEHLESQFDEHMTWDNQGEYWHIDYIIPISVFEFEYPEDEEFQMCWGLDNLRPLKGSENISKNNKILEEFKDRYETLLEMRSDRKTIISTVFEAYL